MQRAQCHSSGGDKGDTNIDGHVAAVAKEELKEEEEEELGLLDALFLGPAVVLPPLRRRRTLVR